MDTNDEHTLVFKAVSGVSVREGGQSVAVEFQASSGQTIQVVIPAEASHTLSRILMRAQIEAAAARGVMQPPPQRSASGSPDGALESGSSQDPA
jgi:uncharacterized protein with LGFP repeats